MTSRGSKNRKQPEPFVIKRRVRPTLVTPSVDDDDEDRDDDRVVAAESGDVHDPVDNEEEEEEEAEEEYIAPRGRITFADTKKRKQRQRHNVKTEKIVSAITTTKKRQRDESTSDEIPLVRVKKEKVEEAEEEEDEQPPIKWEEEYDEEEEDDEEDLPLRQVKRERRLSLSAAVKKEEDDGMPGEAGGGGGGSGSGSGSGNNKKEKERMSVGDGGTTRALGALVEQYMNTESYDEINADSTAHVHGIIREFEDYVYGLTQQGMAGGSVIFEYCHQLIEAIHLWNGNIRTEQANIRDFVLNSIAYNKELYDLYIEQTKRGSASSAAATGGGRNKRNPASLFNTVPTSLTHITLTNVNPSLISSSGSGSSNSNLPVTGDEPPLTKHISNIF